jgi:hypothetical protein
MASKDLTPLIDREMARLCAQGRIAGWTRNMAPGAYRLWTVELNDGTTSTFRTSAAWAFIEGARDTMEREDA